MRLQKITERNAVYIPIEDEIDSDLWYEVTFFDAAVFFTMYGMIPLEQDGLPCADYLGEIGFDLLGIPKWVTVCLRISFVAESHSYRKHNLSISYSLPLIPTMPIMRSSTLGA